MDYRKMLVVCDENVLGYVNVSNKSTVYIFRSLYTKGALWSLSDNAPLSRYNNIRLANEQDFDLFRICSTGYFNDSDYITAESKLTDIDINHLNELTEMCKN